MAEQVEKELTEEQVAAIASVTLPVSGWRVDTTELPGGPTLVVLVLQLQDESGDFVIQPFLAKEDAEALATAILEQTKEN